MLNFILNGKEFLLHQETTVRLVYSNPICFFDENPGDIGLGIDIPVNEVNRAILGNPERFAKLSAGSDRKFSGFEIRFQGILFLLGTLIITNCDEENYNCWVQSHLGSLSEEQLNKNITEMDWPTNQSFVDKETYSDDTDHYAAPVILNPGFWDGIGKEEPDEHSVTDKNGEDQLKSENISTMKKNHRDNYAYFVNNHNLPEVNPGLVISPFMYLRYFITESLRLNKWFINRNDMISDNYNLSLWANAMIYNNFNIVQINGVTEFKQEWTYDETLSREKQINFHQITIYNWAVSQFSFKNLLPKINYGNVVLGLQNFLNFVFHFRRDMNVDIIDRNEALSGLATNLDDWHIGTWVIGQRKDVTLKFISEYDKNDGEFAEMEDLSNRRADFREPVHTYEDLLAIPSASIGELRLVRSENKIYEYKWKTQVLVDIYLQETHHDAIDWEFVSTGPQPYFYGTSDEIEEIKSTIGTPMPIYSEFASTYKTNQKGNLVSMYSLYSDFTFRLMCGNTLFLVNDAFHFDGNTGLFKTRWEKFSKFWKNRLSVSANFNLPANMLLFVIDNITSKFRTREGEFIIYEVEVTLGLNDIGTTKINGFKI